MADEAGRTVGRAGWTPPIGTQQRIRNRAIWSVALFASSVAPAIVGLGIVQAGGAESINIAMPMAFGFCLLGMVMAMWAAFPTLRYWEGLPAETRWMGALPLLTLSLFVSAAMLAAVL
jgi:hypothetical protein